MNSKPRLANHWVLLMHKIFTIAVRSCRLQSKQPQSRKRLSVHQSCKKGELPTQNSLATHRTNRICTGITSPTDPAAWVSESSDSLIAAGVLKRVQSEDRCCLKAWLERLHFWIDRIAICKMGLVEDFEKAAEEATTLLPASLSQEIQLILYSLFKQAKFGDNETSKALITHPSFWWSSL